MYVNSVQHSVNWEFGHLTFSYTPALESLETHLLILPSPQNLNLKLLKHDIHTYTTIHTPTHHLSMLVNHSRNPFPEKTRRPKAQSTPPKAAHLISPDPFGPIHRACSHSK
jgi:hypothetical protein